MKVSIIIPVWNSEKLLKKYLALVVDAKKNKKNHISEIIAIDDASTDNSAKYIKNTFSKEIRMIKQNTNKGFSSTVNLGASKAKSDLICLLNTDVAVSKDFLQSTITHFNDKKVFAVSLHEKGFGPAAGYFKHGFLEHIGLPEASEPIESFWASGGSAVFRKKYWDELKGFDEDLYSPFYWEDIDLSYRAQKRGYKIIWDPNAKVQHKHESVINSNNFSREYLNNIVQRNQLLFIWKNITSKKLFNQHRRGLLRRILKHPGYIKIFYLALTKISVVEKLHSQEKVQQIISDEEVFKRFSEN